jgi:hypothetical protein
VQLVGTIQVSGRYNVLDFNNVASVHRGSFAIQVQALAFAREPVVIQWQQVGT